MTSHLVLFSSRWQRWREHRRHGVPQLAYRLLRRLLDRSGLARIFDCRVHQVIAVAPWQLRLPPRLPRQLQVRELGASDLAELERLRPAKGAAYPSRFASAHRALGAFLEGRLVAFLWIRRGPAHLPASFGAVWQLAAPMAWVYDLYSDPEVLGAMPHLYAHLRQHPPGEACRLLVGQTDFDNLRSRLAHGRLGYEVRAVLWSGRCGGRWLHLSRARGDGRWRWHRHGALIPLYLFPPANPPRPARAVPLRPRPGQPSPGVRLQCECGRGVELQGDRYVCVCGRELGHRSAGVAVIGAPMPYWGEIPQAEMEAVLDHAGRKGWRAAVQACLSEELRNYVGAAERADFHDLLPLPPGARILDVGAGWGGIAAPLARHYQVVALEGVAERARFIALRQQQEGLQGLSVVNGDVHRTPLATGQFDAIVANGILEWVALLDLSAPPTAVQLLFLHRLRELLAPGGIIYLAIENRCGWSELRGALDHSGLPYTSLLPRPLARWMCAHSSSYRAHFNVGYRTYTYTHRGYADLFAQVGLRIRTTWISPAGYNHPSKLIPLEGGAIRFAQRNGSAACGLRGHLRYAMRRAAARPVVWRWFGSDFAFLLEAADQANEVVMPAPAGTQPLMGGQVA